MMAALIIGILVGLTMGALLVDVLFVQPLCRDNKDLIRAARRWQRNAENWESLASVRHPGTPYIRTGFDALLEDTFDHSKGAELRVVSGGRPV